MHVIKRNGQKQAVSFDKIIFRLKKLATDKKLTSLGNVFPDIVAQKVIQSMYDGITSSQIDELSARVCIAMSVEHSEYATLASRIAISNLHKNTSECFSDTIQQLYDNVDKLGHKSPLVSEELYGFVQQTKDVLNFAIDYQRDYLFDYFGFKTLERSYLLKVGSKIIERPQHMWMRVALGIHPGNMEKALETYHLLSEFYFIHATPTLFNAGTPKQQMSSCFEENMIIGTVNRGLVKIKDVEIGDDVRTHLGNVKPVVQLHKNLLGDRTLYNLKISGCSDIKVTGNHRLWTLRDNLFQWVSVEDITFEDYISTGHSFQVPGAEYAALGGVIALKVMSKTEITENKPEYVYTLGVQDDHSYNVEGIIAENCFLIGTDDSMGGIYKTISDCAQISKYAGGIGVHVSNIRGDGSYIKGTNGTADGIVKMLRVYNETARYANQGSKRNGSFAIYLEPWHSDIFEFLELKKNTGDENTKCRDLYYALWVPDAFMKAVETDSQWYLMSPDTCPGLSDAYGEEFDTLYHRYVSEGKYRKEVNARDLWTNILVSQIETGMPYMLYKDHVNKKSNQKNIGTIKSSNLCVAPETLILTDKGYKIISELENQKVNVWNGEEFTETTVVKTGENQKLVQVTFSDGTILDCTPYHKFYIKTPDDQVKQVCASELENNMRIIQAKYPFIEGCGTNQDVNTSVDVRVNELDKRFQFDLYSDYAGYISVRAIRGTKDAQNIKMYAQTLGINAFISSIGNEWFVCFPKKDLADLETRKGIKWCIDVKDASFDIVEKYITVVSVQDNGRISDTFCFKEEKRGMGIFNGIITGQCAEILLYSDKDEYAVCNIATLSLPKYVEKTTGGKFTYNYQKLFEITRIVTRNLNNVIDYNFYPVPETKKSNMRHRPIAIGAQGLANTFFKMSYPFESDEAVDLNKKIFETIYYAALYESNILAKEHGSYETFQGSPTSQGILQYDMWGLNENDLSCMWDWKELKENIKKDGLRNSMLTACPPTASTSQILGNFESFEPITSNIFMRSTLSGDFPVVNKYLIEDLQALGLWNNTMKERIMYYNGSIQNISEIPYHLKQVYKTVWECSQKNLMNMSRDRGYFTDHTQSFNLFMNNITPAKLNSAHFHGWKLGLKTSMYYCRSRSASQAQKFTVSVATQKMEELRLQQEEVLACSRENPESCMMCSG
jgi:ribonucleotide reductase alpha subunit